MEVLTTEGCKQPEWGCACQTLGGTMLTASSIKKKIRGAALRAFPELALQFFSIRSRRMIESQARQLGLDKLAREVSRATGSTVAAGPFAGMRLDYELFRVHASPKFLGTYEQELHRVIE